MVEIFRTFRIFSGALRRRLHRGSLRRLPLNTSKKILVRSERRADGFSYIRIGG